MPLSEHEQRLLEQIERALYADDPKLASSVRAINPRTYAIRRLWRSLFLFLLGLAVLVAGVAVSSSGLYIVFGLLGFVMMLVAALRGYSDLRRLSGHVDVDRRAPRTKDTSPGPTVLPGGAAGRRPRPTGGQRRPQTGRASFMDRIEDRWRRRWDDPEQR